MAASHRPCVLAEHGENDASVEFEHLLNEGLTHHQAGRMAAARQCYEQVLTLVPMQADALNLLGVLCAQEGQPEAAIHLLTRAVAARPKDGDILNNLGRFLLETWRFEEARDPLERAVALQPYDLNARYNLAGVLRQLHLYLAYKEQILYATQSEAR